MVLEKTQTDKSESLRSQTEKLQAEPNERIAFSREDEKKILAALDQPFEPNAALSRAMRAAESIEANAQKA